LSGSGGTVRVLVAVYSQCAHRSSICSRPLLDVVGALIRLTVELFVMNRHFGHDASDVKKEP